MSRPPLLVGLVILLAAGGQACADPIHDAEVNALGPEAPGVHPGPTHRAGQPCLTCHSGEGPASATFVTAGTIYVSGYVPGTTTYPPLVGGDVHLVDSNGSTYDATTNAVGNFYVTPDEWSPVFPLGDKPADSGVPSLAEDISVAATPGSTNTTPMMTSIERGGVYASCAYCHFDPPGPTSPGHIYQQ